MSDSSKSTPTVPETMEGWAVLHQVFHVDWSAWKKRGAGERSEAVREAQEFFGRITKPARGHSAFYRVLGHKGDLLVLHFRESFGELADLETGFKKLGLSDDLKPADSYVSYLELGLYEMTVKLHREFLAAGEKPESDEWVGKWKAAMAGERERMMGRLFPAIPGNRYFCFYPMDKKRGELKNWYELPMEERQSMMRDHGLIGRKYGGRVTQVITGSIGFDDREWGVYLFADDPVVFKKLIYEMRFDEASAAYAVFGPFTTGLRLESADLSAWLEIKD